MKPHSLLFVVALASLSACSLLKPAPQPKIVEPQPVVPLTAADPLATHFFTLQPGQEVVGELQVTHASKDDTLSDIARRFNLGYEELVRANPSVDPWVPGEGREVILPTQFVLPDAPHEGLVVNLAALRVFFFPKPAPGQPQIVITHPIGIGKVGWNTPEGTTKVVSKRKDPLWIPPESVRKEHAERGDPLPKQVPAGPDNPLGAFAMNLGWPGYLIHGTNKPYGVGMRSSHGCLRFYPEDIALLFNEIPIGLPVRVVNQRLTHGWREGQLYVQVMPPSEEELDAQQQPVAKKAAPTKKDAKAKSAPSLEVLTPALQASLLQQAQARGQTLNVELLQQLAQQHTGVSLPVTNSSATIRTQAQLLAAARKVENRVPDGATWDGNKELLVSAEEFDAMRNGVILPKKEAAKPAASPNPPAKRSTKPSQASGNTSTSVAPVVKTTL